MPALTDIFELDRCPHCRVDHPYLQVRAVFETTTHTGTNHRVWKTYACTRCGGAVLAASESHDHWAKEIYPNTTVVDESIPEPARTYLNQAIGTLHSPAGSVMLSATAVDAMLKAKLYKEGSLYARINKAVEDHLITQEMAQWAHSVRLDANDQRHADEKVSLPTTEDAQRSIDFVLALGTFLFVLPSRVKSGLANASSEINTAASET